MNATPSAPAEIGAPSETVTADATELNTSPAKPLTTTPLSTAINNTLEASATPEGKLPKVCFLFGAGAEAYYGMPLGARFAVEVFRRQDQGKDIFTKIKTHFLQQLETKANEPAERRKALEQYEAFLPNTKDSPLRIYTLTSNYAGTIIRELIQEHYEDILQCFKEFGSEDKSMEIKVLKQLLNDGYDLRLLLLALRQILGLPAPDTNDTKEYKKAPVTWARAKLKKLVQEIEKKNFFTMLPEQIQDVTIKNDSGATESPQYSGEEFLASLKFGGESNEYAAINNIWEMPLFTVIAVCSHILYTRLHQKEERKEQISEKDTNVTAKLAYCNEITMESLQGILEIIAAASAQDYTKKGENDLARIQQFSPMFGTINLIRAINFDKVGSSLLKLLFEELSREAAPWKKPFEDAKKSLKNRALSDSTPTAGEGQAATNTVSEASDFPSLQRMESALPALTLMAQELFFTVASEFISYKGLIDGMWRYLYNPKANWTKFSQLSCFLFAVHAYILEQARKCSGEHGYYEQVREAKEKKLFTTGIFATTNYTTLIRKRLFSQEEQDQLQSETYYLEHPNERKLAYLNGSTSFIYDPYLNDMYEAPRDKEDWTQTEQLEQFEHFVVPLMFTQSGTKAMTVVEMNDMYASLFHNWLESDAVVLIGFNCNKDDAHINAMLRKFLKLSKGQKPIIIVTPDPNEELFANKLHLNGEYRSCLRLIGITDLVSNSVNGVMWYEELHRILQEWYQTPHDVKAQSNLASVASGTSDEA